MKANFIIVGMVALSGMYVHAQDRLETGSKKPMPQEWVDQETGHKVVRLSRLPGSSGSFYFHNNPFVGDKMFFYNTVDNNRQVFTVDLKTLKTEQITHQKLPMRGEIVAHKSQEVVYQIQDSVFASSAITKKTRLLYVFPAEFKATISTMNADETVLAGRYSDGNAEREILKQYPEKSQYFNRIYDAKIPNTLFTVDLKTGKFNKIHTENTWLGHVQFSPTDKDILMFCQEGPWHKVDRIWTINIANGEVKKRHNRSMDMEIAGHEFFAPDGKTIWFDHQMPRSTTFYLTGVDLKTGAEKKYQLQRNEWSIHFNISPDQKLFAGDGGDPKQVAKAEDGMWIYLFRPVGDKLEAERLVNMKAHGYKLEPNVHFSPDGKWVIFRANFEGESQVYAVEIAKK
ncbi:MAG: oligogalacturonate lyase family protein [Candidatus Pedobacter colombiensis]|uniref:Oligogalacturonate lyase family protein n=1 Tax=Candidatus Pedobacter colombiensis TaxID=3121371 RepID=A0AAJ5W937_9SPHI|nr:oligogalacturonate lyase family protein [Pedobacter sp.]WEK20184.1 MAG: oligogalacturonate lyase family protein [Pedobacter sp.]